MSETRATLINTDATVDVQIVAGDPLIGRATEIYREMLSAAGVDHASEAQPPQERPQWRTTFHVAVDGSGTALGVVHATLGTLDQIGMADLIDPEEHLATPVCECPSIAVAPEATGRGVTELLYRSVYCFARRQGARSLAAVVDPLTLDLFRDDYGVMFRALGPVSRYLGFEMVAVGEELEVLEDAVRRARPEFYDFLTEPFTAVEREQLGL